MDDNQAELERWRKESAAARKPPPAVPAPAEPLSVAAAVVEARKLWPWEDRPNLDLLASLAPRFERVRGSFAEFGVGRGSTAMVLAALAAQFNRVLHLFDTFEGLPGPGPEDLGIYRGQKEILDGLVGKFAAGVADVEALVLAVAPKLRLAFHKGLFAGTARFIREARPLALLHIDACWQYSTAEALHHAAPYLATGGIVVVSDYDAWPSARVSLNRYCQARGKQLTVEAGAAWYVH